MRESGAFTWKGVNFDYIKTIDPPERGYTKLNSNKVIDIEIKRTDWRGGNRIELRPYIDLRYVERISFISMIQITGGSYSGAWVLTRNAFIYLSICDGVKVVDLYRGYPKAIDDVNVKGTIVDFVFEKRAENLYVASPKIADNVQGNFYEGNTSILDPNRIWIPRIILSAAFLGSWKGNNTLLKATINDIITEKITQINKFMLPLIIAGGLGLAYILSKR